MPGDVAMRTMTGVLLVAMIAFFAGSLGQTLLDQQKAQGLRLTPGTDTDPGIRVLLLARPPGDAQPTPAHDKLVVDVLVPCLVVTPDEPENQERVFAVAAGEQIVFRPDADGIMISTPSREERWLVTRVRVQPKATTVEPVDDAEPEPPARLNATRFEAADARPVFMLGQRRYRGSLQVEFKSAKELVAINHLPMEAYVEAVVAVEMSSSWPLEALKAQAIASRSYAYATRLRIRGKRPFDVNDTVDFQEYKGHGFGSDLVERAVLATRGVVLFTQGQPFAPLFHASSGGWTESIDNVVPGSTALYGAPLSSVMPAQEDKWCRIGAEALGKLASHWQTRTVIKPGDIRNRLNAWLHAHGDSHTINYVSDVRVGRRDPLSKRVETVVVHHVGSTGFELSAHDFRMVIGPKDIRSTLWLDDAPRRIDGTEHDHSKVYDIGCFGWGHGVGMSQISAWAMAQDGRLHTEILSFFYPGSELRTWGRASP